VNAVPSHRLKRLKRALRREVRARRDGLPLADREARSAAIAARLLALPELERSGTVMAFWSFGSEVDTAPILGGLDAAGIRVALPRIERGDVVPVAYRLGDPVAATSFGAMEPAAGEVLSGGELDVVVTPGLAFDRSGFRTGYGGGYYDRLLRVLRPEAFRVGICFALQLVEEVPHGNADLPVDAIVTEDEVIHVAGT
jgi:5-formyltetrahydrofolate cyclo-ligase